MPTYVYETIPAQAGRKPRRFEIRQSIKDAALSHDPETGEPVRRVISGGAGLITGQKASPGQAPSGGHCCGHGGCCH